MNDNSEILVQSLTLLQQGVSAELCDMEEAMELNVAALGFLAGGIMSLPPDYNQIIRRNAEENRLKVENLRRIRWMKEQPKFFPEFPMQFVRIPIPVEKFSVPLSSFSRVFWLMRSLRQSIQKGAFLTPKLYVAKDIWYQEGIFKCLRHIGAKQRFFSSLSQAVIPIAAIHSLNDMSIISGSLLQFKNFVIDKTKKFEEEIGNQNSLQQRKKSFWSSFQLSLVASEKEVKYEQFLGACTALFDQCQIFERLHIYFSEAVHNHQIESTEVIDILTHISKVLYSGPCLCVLRDMIILVDRYHHKCRKSVCSLLPVDPKIAVDD